MNTPYTETVRVTVPVRPEVLEAFKRLAAAGNMSTGKAMGEWLADTIEGVEYMALKMEEARSAPSKVMREMHAYALGLADETGELMEKIKEDSRQERQATGRERKPGQAPGARKRTPLSNTGVTNLKKKNGRG